jgi:hypothetical protein
MRFSNFISKHLPLANRVYKVHIFKRGDLIKLSEGGIGIVSMIYKNNTMSIYRMPFTYSYNQNKFIENWQYDGIRIRVDRDSVTLVKSREDL